MWLTADELLLLVSSVQKFATSSRIFSISNVEKILTSEQHLNSPRLLSCSSQHLFPNLGKLWLLDIWLDIGNASEGLVLELDMNRFDILRLT